MDSDVVNIELVETTQPDLTSPRYNDSVVGMVENPLWHAKAQPAIAEAKSAPVAIDIAHTGKGDGGVDGV